MNRQEVKFGKLRVGQRFRVKSLEHYLFEKTATHNGNNARNLDNGSTAKVSRRVTCLLETEKSTTTIQRQQ